MPPVGMNDTMRSDFDPARLFADLDQVVSALRAAGALVISVRHHEHHRVFPLPAFLRRALGARISALNDILDAVAARHRIAVVDLAHVPGIYSPAAWAIDRVSQLRGVQPSRCSWRSSVRSCRARCRWTAREAGPRAGWRTGAGSWVCAQ